jgi:hypothetical protein
MIVAFVHDETMARAIAASFEEEGVPVSITVAAGDAETLARCAARDAPAGIGIGGDADRLVVTLAAASGSPYLTGTPAAARHLGTCAARLVRRGPLPFPTT